MLTRKQQLARKQQKQKEESERAKLMKQLGRNPDGSVPKKKKEKSTLNVQRHAEHLDVALVAEQPKQAEAREIIHDEPFKMEGWEEREAQAQVEIEKKKKRVAPLYNKGGYQYVTDETDTTTLGRKV